MPGVTANLRALKPELAAEQGDTLGAQLLRRRRELGLRRVDAAKLLGTNLKSLMWWERNDHEPLERFWPSIIRYLGREPWSPPASIGERLRAERRRRGLSIASAAAMVGVDEGTFGRWERGAWKPQPRSMPRIALFFGE
jgi:transcriptional regulator with XRE-family HTH domain